MKRQFIAVAILFGLSGSVTAGERPRMLEEFNAEQASEILHQGAVALAVIERDLPERGQDHLPIEVQLTPFLARPRSWQAVPPTAAGTMH